MATTTKSGAPAAGGPHHTQDGGLARLQFTPVTPSTLPIILQVLKDRLPRSGHIYNNALRLSRHPGEFPMYFLNPEGGEEGETPTPAAWILVVHRPKGLPVRQLVGISSPVPTIITPAVRQAFSETEAYSWDESIMFGGIDRVISPMLVELSIYVKNNTTTCYPQYYYTMGREEAVALNPLARDSMNGEARRLDLDQGATFVASNWKHATSDTVKYARDVIKRLPSCGVYVKDAQEGVYRPVSAVVTHTDMLAGMLMTDPDHRNKGYATVCMRTYLRDLSLEGYVPSSCANQKNKASCSFHAKVGMVVDHEADYVKSEPYSE